MVFPQSFAGVIIFMTEAPFLLALFAKNSQQVAKYPVSCLLYFRLMFYNRNCFHQVRCD